MKNLVGILMLGIGLTADCSDRLLPFRERFRTLAARSFPTPSLQLSTPKRVCSGKIRPIPGSLHDGCAAARHL